MSRSWSVKLGVCAAATALDLIVFGCSVGSVDVTGKVCPCPSDFSCDVKSNTCVHGAATTSGSGPTTSASSSTGSSGGGGTGGGGMCAGVCGTPGCGTCPMPNVVAVDGYDIDATEVTRAAYGAFLDTNPDPANQPGICNWNKNFAPIEDDTPDGCDKPFDPVTYPNRPIVCIDWCDAAAFCKWTGRHLCGRIGGGVLQQTDAADPTKSQWMNACSMGGALVFPYGNTWDATKCNAAGGGQGGIPIDVATLSGCEGGYPGIFDMVGNVEEWEDACGIGVDPNDPSDDGCELRGGAYWSDASVALCSGIAQAPPRSGVSNDWGIRCCGG